MNEITRKYQKFIKENPQECKADLLEITDKLQNSNAKWKVVQSCSDLFYQHTLFDNLFFIFVDNINPINFSEL